MALASSSVRSATLFSSSTLRDLIQNIKNNYIRDETLCNNEDIFVILERNGLKKNVEK